MGWETFLSGCTESLHINERNDHREKYKATSRKKRSIKNWKKHNQRELNLAWELLTFCTIYQIYWWLLGARKKLFWFHRQNLSIYSCLELWVFSVRKSPRN